MCACTCGQAAGTGSRAQVCSSSVQACHAPWPKVEQHLMAVANWASTSSVFSRTPGLSSGTMSSYTCASKQHSMWASRPHRIMSQTDTYACMAVPVIQEFTQYPGAIRHASSPFRPRWCMRWSRRQSPARAPPAAELSRATGTSAAQRWHEMTRMSRVCATVRCMRDAFGRASDSLFIISATLWYSLLL